MNEFVLKAIIFIAESHRQLVGRRIVVVNVRGLGTGCNIVSVDDRKRLEYVRHACGTCTDEGRIE